MATDMTKQAEALMKTWMDVQQRTWENWFKTVQSMGATQAAGMWERERERTSEAWEQSVKQAMDAQAEWMKTMTQMMMGQGTAQKAPSMTGQSHEMMQTWATTQQQLWDSWFATARQVLDLSERMLKQNLEMQQQMMQTWAQQAQQTNEKKGSK